MASTTNRGRSRVGPERKPLVVHGCNRLAVLPEATCFRTELGTQKEYSGKSFMVDIFISLHEDTSGDYVKKSLKWFVTT